jgi:general secretion pathway protein A
MNFDDAIALNPSQRLQSMNLPIEASIEPMISPFDPGESTPASPAVDSFLALVSSPLETVAPAPPIELSLPSDFIRYYGLRENPFSDSISPRYFFRTDAHAEAFRSMMLAVDFEASLGMVTGPSGTGKTLVTQLLLQHLVPPRHQAILVLVTPGMTKTGLLREILSELNLALPVGNCRVQDLARLLSNYIIDLHQQGRRLVIILDECHLLSSECLHVVRTISNIETPEKKLSTCLLFGENRLAQRLNHPSYDSLRNRIYLRSELPSLSVEDAAQFVKYRLMTAGRLQDLFTPSAMEALHRGSKGIARSLNKLAMLSLVEGGQMRRLTIDETVVEKCIPRL